MFKLLGLCILITQEFIGLFKVYCAMHFKSWPSRVGNCWALLDGVTVGKCGFRVRGPGCYQSGVGACHKYGAVKRSPTWVAQIVVIAISLLIVRILLVAVFVCCRSRLWAKEACKVVWIM